jgi:hypothetical protein
MAEREYIRLARPRLKARFLMAAARSSLWLGKDHLLCVEATGCTERYKRFYFRDIQAITVQRTRAYFNANIILLPLVALSLFIGFVSDVHVERIVLWSIALALGIPLIANLVRGPSCVCRIRTAVQEEEIPALAAIRKTTAVLARIRPLLAEAQGLVAPEEIPRRMQELAAQNQPRLVVDDPNLPPRMVA